MGNYHIRFDRTNSNNLLISQNGNEPAVIACPITNKECDIIDLTNYTNPDGHLLTFSGVTLITDNELRSLYIREKLVDLIHRGAR